MSETTILKSVLTGLKADADLMSLVSDVYETAPDDAVAPYITFSRLRLTDTSTKTSQLFSISMDLTIWDQSASSRTVRQILDRLRTVVPDLTADTGSFIGLSVRDTDLLRDKALNWQRSTVSIQGHYSP